MTLDTLKSDHQQNRARFAEQAVSVKAEIDALPSGSPEALTKLFDFVKAQFSERDAFTEAQIEELDEIDGCVYDIINKHEDILQPETAAVFAALIVNCLSIAKELGGRLNRKSPADAQVGKALAQVINDCKAARTLLEQITVAPEAEGDDEPEDDGDDEVAANDEKESTDADAAK